MSKLGKLGSFLFRSRGQVSIEFLMIFIIFMSVFTFVSIPLYETAYDSVKDASLLISSKTFLNSVRDNAYMVYVTGGSKVFSIYNPCSAVLCREDLLYCGVSFERDPNNPLVKIETKKTYSVDVPPVLINGVNCSSNQGQLISLGSSYLRMSIG